MDKSDISKIKEILSDKTKRIVIVSHVNPDGDAVGSSMGVYHFLKNDHYEHVEVISPGSFPSFLAWMPSINKIVIADRQKNKTFSAIEKADLIFCLDFNDMDRTDLLADALKNAPGKKILIDHHPDPMPQFDIVFSVVKASSTAELIYEFILALDKQHLIDENIAQCLYAGIVTDTGSFSYACNHPRTYYITAQLISSGIDGEKIHRNIYDTYSESRIRLLGHCLSKNLKVLHSHNAAYIFLSQKDLEEFDHQEGDTEGVVNYALSMKGIVLGAIFIEKDDLVKISFRSEGSVNVNILARKYFNGGGHKNASGGYSKDTLKNTLAFFEKLLDDIAEDDFASLRVVQDND